MAAVVLDMCSFGAYLHKPIEKFILDLSECNVVEIVKQYELFKRKLRPSYSLSSVIYNIKRIERNFGITLQPLQITDDFYLHFYAFMLMQNVCPSTIENYCSNIRACLTWACKHNVTVSSTFDQFEFPEYHKNQVALTPDEVSLVAHYDIDNGFKGRRKDCIETMKRVRDMFVLSCNLGQRWSDMVRISPECFNRNRNKFTIVQKKTNNKAVVDIDKYSFDKRVTYDILERYDYTAPYTATIGNYNYKLHELLKTIGQNFDDNVCSENKIKDEVVIVDIPKWKAIASHTARRSFATYNIMRDISEAKVRRCTGHKDSRSFCQYVIWGDDED